MVNGTPFSLATKSDSVTMPHNSPRSLITGRPPTFRSSMIFAASSREQSSCNVMTGLTIISRTNLLIAPHCRTWESVCPYSVTQTVARIQALLLAWNIRGFGFQQNQGPVCAFESNPISCILNLAGGLPRPGGHDVCFPFRPGSTDGLLPATSRQTT